MPAKKTKATTNPAQLGEKIKILRQKSGVLTEDLAPILDLSPQVLDKIEKGVLQPTVATLLKVAQYFGIAMESFFTDELLNQNIQVNRAHEAPKVDRPRVSGENVLSYQFRALAPNVTNKKMLPFFLEIDPRQSKPLQPLSHEGEEFLYILEGEVQFKAKDEVINLKEGDSIYYHSNIPHAVQAKGPDKAKALAIVYQTPN